MNNYNEKEIIALLQDSTRQREAFEAIVKEYSEQLYWQIRRLVLSHDDANDILQNTFIKAWTNIDYFRGDAKMSTWLYRIALNECLTFLKRQRKRNLSIDEMDQEVIDKLESEGDHVFRGELAYLFEYVKDPIELIKWKDLLEGLENTLDHCERMADLLKGVVMKYA